MTITNVKAEYRLSGYWVATDIWRSEISIIISRKESTYDVRVVDQSDGEEAEIYGANLVRNSKSQEEILSFGALFSSGQFTKYKLRRLGEEIEVVFTYTDTLHCRRENVITPPPRRRD